MHYIPYTCMKCFNVSIFLVVNKLEQYYLWFLQNLLNEAENFDGSLFKTSVMVIFKVISWTKHWWYFVLNGLTKDCFSLETAPIPIQVLKCVFQNITCQPSWKATQLVYVKHCRRQRQSSVSTRLAVNVT